MYKKYSILVICLMLSFFLNAQDFEVYPRLKDDNVIMPELYENTLFSEYQVMSRNIKMMDMSYAMLIPGYIHFKAKDKTTGFVLLGARVAAIGGIIGVSLKTKNDYNVIEDLLNIDPNIDTEKIIISTSLAIIISSYFFDWIHGKYRLEKKQELIRYKYSVKLKMDEFTNYSKENQSLGLSLNVNF